jgi:hypothetical protein
MGNIQTPFALLNYAFSRNSNEGTAIYGRGVSDERTRSAGTTPIGRNTESARDGADLRTRRQVGD